MDGSRQWSITPRQAGWLIAMTILGDGIFFLPTASTVAAWQDAWVSFALATVAGLGFAWLAVTLGNRFPGQTIIEYSRTIAGPFLGSLLGLLYVTYFFITTSYMTREFGEFLVTTVMPETPITVFMIVLMLLCVYALKEGLEVLGRMGDFLFPVYLFFFVFTIAFVLPGVSLDNLSPVLENPPGKIVKGMFPPAAWVAEVSAMLVLLPYVNNKSHALKWSMIGVLAGGGLMTIVQVALLATFGPALVAHFQFPFYSLSRYVEVAMFIERLEAFAMGFWVLGDVIRTSVFFFVASTGLARWLGLSDYRPLLLPMAAIIVPLGILQFDSIVEIHTYGGGLYTLYALSIKIGIPLLLLVLSSITGARKESQEAHR